MVRPRWVVISAALGAAAVVGAAVLVTADDSSPESAGEEPASEPALPPDDAEALAALFDPALEPLGLRLTRGGLADGPGAADNPLLAGRHLALYVEPIAGEHTAAQYLDTLVSSARVFLPEVFERWPDIVSMDVCQEPPPGVDDRAVPPPLTTLEVTRAQSDALDWATIDLAGFAEAAAAGSMSLFVHGDLQADPAWPSPAATPSTPSTSAPPRVSY